jgi:hypothetical protein
MILESKVGPTPKILLLKQEIHEKKIATTLQTGVLQDSTGVKHFAVEQ